MTINLAEELLLLAYDDAGSAQAGTPALDYGLSGGLLLELILAGRLDVVDKRCVVTDPSSTGDPVVDAALSEIAGEEKRHTAPFWVSRLSKDLRDRILDKLVADNVLRREEDKVLWIFPRTRYPSATGDMPSAEAETRSRLAAAVRGIGPIDARTAALGGLVRALHLEATAVPERPRKEVRDRLKEIAAGDWSADDVRRAIDEVDNAVATAVTEATVITTTAASAI